jgi:hypothetical protein
MSCALPSGIWPNEKISRSAAIGCIAWLAFFYLSDAMISAAHFLCSSFEG